MKYHHSNSYAKATIFLTWNMLPFCHLLSLVTWTLMQIIVCILLCWVSNFIVWKWVTWYFPICQQWSTSNYSFKLLVIGKVTSNHPWSLLATIGHPLISLFLSFSILWLSIALQSYSSYPLWLILTIIFIFHTLVAFLSFCLCFIVALPLMPLSFPFS